MKGKLQNLKNLVRAENCKEQCYRHTVQHEKNQIEHEKKSTMLKITVQN